MARSMWVGRDEHQGVRAQPRKDVPPPPHWRLEAIAATPRPHAVTVGADRRHAVFVQDADIVRGVAARPGGAGRGAGAPHRGPGARELVGVGAAAALARRRASVAYVDGDHVHVAPVAGGPAKRLVEGDEPVLGRRPHARRRGRARRRDAARRASTCSDPWPRRLAADDGKGDEFQAAVSPDGTEVAYVFVPRDDLARSEIRVALAARAGHGGRSPARRACAIASPPGRRTARTLAYASERSGFYELHLVDRRRRRRAAADRGRRGPRRPRLAPGRRPHPRHPHAARAHGARGRRRATGEAEQLAPGGAVERRALDGRRRRGRRVRGPPHAARAAPGRAARAAAPRTVHAPAPRPVRAAPACGARGGDLPLLRRARDPRVPAAPARRLAPTGRCPPSSARTAGPIDFAGDMWDGEAQYFVDKGYAWLAPNFRGSASYGRAFEHGNHGNWGVGDTHDCLAAADHLRTLDWVRGDRIGIFGASYGSYMALSAVGDDTRGALPLRGLQVRRHGPRDVVGAGRPRRRAGARDDDGHAGNRARGLPRRVALPPAGERARARSSSPPGSWTSA